MSKTIESSWPKIIYVVSCLATCGPGPVRSLLIFCVVRCKIDWPADAQNISTTYVSYFGRRPNSSVVGSLIISIGLYIWEAHSVQFCRTWQSRPNVFSIKVVCELNVYRCSCIYHSGLCLVCFFPAVGPPALEFINSLIFPPTIRCNAQ